MKRTYDAILLLGLALAQDGSPLPELCARVDRAARVWRDGLAPVIVCCGGPTGGSGRTEAEVMAERLLKSGVPEAAVIREDRSMVTSENIANARQLLPDARRVVLVTSDYHIFRARLICRRAGLRVHAVPAPTPSGKEKRRLRLAEVMYTMDFLVGWSSETRPAWAKKLRDRLLG